MLKRIKMLWKDAEIAREYGMYEVSILERYKKFGEVILIKREDKLFSAVKEEKGSIAIYDCESDEPFIRLS